MNRLQLIGRLGRAPEVKETPRGLVATLSLATNEYWKDRETGETRAHTEWHTLVCFDRLAEVAREFLQKGDEIYAEGKVRTTKWTDKDGMQRVDREMRIDEMQMLRRSRSDAFSSAITQLTSIEELARKLQAGDRQDASYGDLANMMTAVRETLPGER